MTPKLSRKMTKLASEPIRGVTYTALAAVCKVEVLDAGIDGGVQDGVESIALHFVRLALMLDGHGRSRDEGSAARDVRRRASLRSLRTNRSWDRGRGGGQSRARPESTSPNAAGEAGRERALASGGSRKRAANAGLRGPALEPIPTNVREARR